MTLYATLAQLKSQLTIADTDRDVLLNAAIAAASRRVDTYCGRTFGLDVAASARSYDPDRRISRRLGGAEVFLIDDVGDVTGMLVETGYYTGATYQTITDFATDRPNAIAEGYPVTGLLRAYGWYTGPSNRLRVTAKWGWPAVPGEVVEATLIMAARLFRRKDSPEGVLGASEWGTVRVSSRIDPDFADLLSALTRPGFA